MWTSGCVDIANNGEPSRARTCDPLIKSAVRSTASDYGSYNLLTFVTGCSRQRVHLLPPITGSFHFGVVTSLSQPQELRSVALRASSYVARSVRRPCFDDGIAAIIERRRALTTSEDLKIFATSGSSTTATVPLDIFAANRFGCDLL